MHSRLVGRLLSPDTSEIPEIQLCKYNWIMSGRRIVYGVVIVVLVMVDLIGLLVLRDAWQSAEMRRTMKTNQPALPIAPGGAASVEREQSIIRPGRP